jgi:acyl-coenzyme A thioesterase PaaI-like protein
LRYKIVTVETNTVYYASAKPDSVLYATGGLVQQGKKLLHAEARVFDADDRLIAGGKAIYFIMGEDDGVYASGRVV